MWRTKEKAVGLKNLSTVDDRHLKVVALKNKKNKNPNQNRTWEIGLPEPQHYWNRVGSSCKRMEQKLVKIQNVALKHPPRSMENYTYRLRERSYKKAWQEFRLCWGKVFITNSDFPAHHCKNSVFALYVLHVSVNRCTYFPFFLVKKRLLPNYADMYISEPTLHHKLYLSEFPT